MGSTSTERIYPLRQPAKHNPPPRLTLTFPETQTQVFTAYIGIQLQALKNITVSENLNSEPENFLDLLSEPRSKITSWLQTSKPTSTESFIVLNDTPNQRENLNTTANPDTQNPISLIWVCYWITQDSYTNALATLNLPALHDSLPSSHRSRIGFWVEGFISDVARLETVYSKTDYMPGLARLPGTDVAEHVHTGYWGAARDRIPGSGNDLFAGETNADNRGARSTSSLGSYITGTNSSDMVHIRSGQFWANCEEEEERAYLENVEPKLRGGLSYLWSSPEESGSSGVRYLRNTALNFDIENGSKADSQLPSLSDLVQQCPKEACVTAFFDNMADLERWASKHPSHLAIHAGAISHGRRFGDARRFRTWHEVSVIRHGEARFEYVNCVDGTGVGKGMVGVQRRRLAGETCS